MPKKRNPEIDPFYFAFTIIFIIALLIQIFAVACNFDLGHRLVIYFYSWLVFIVGVGIASHIK